MPFGTYIKGSELKIPYKRKEALIRKVERDRQNGMNSTLLVLITRLIINSGEANIDIKEAQLREPMMMRRSSRSSINKLPSTIITNRPKTVSIHPNILNFFSFSVYVT